MNESPYITKVSETEDGDLFLEFPEELLEAMGWEDGTLLNIDVFANRLILQKVTSDHPGEAGVSS